MSTEFIIYADESESSGKYFSNFYGGALIRAQHEQEIFATLTEAKESQNLFGEIKWAKVTDQYLQKYMAIMDTFFELIADHHIKVRIMFTKNSNVPQGLEQYHYANGYFLLYYEFIKHGFGLRYCNPEGKQRIRLKLLFDKLPDASSKNQDFKNRLLSLNREERFQLNKIILTPNAIGEVDSHDHPVLQCLDIVLGAMHFRLNDKHKEKPSGVRRRGKRTIAKEKLYKHIRSHICELYPNFNVGVSTSIHGDVHNSWLHSYSHWCFVPSNAMLDPSKGKHVKEK